ncbi:DsbC family protein [Marinobacter confluentis]|uniref:Thiol:disulfide interchange protein n=2 Tax=Marinobacter confluentis TaxID=1697557 RepID=A0A4Z1BU94_9GAMM|nr:DsbC family protein [Marinobacter confluentis]
MPMIRTNRSISLLIAALSCAFFMTSASADATDDIEAKLAEAIPQLDITGVTESEVPGFYEVSSSNGGNLLVSEDVQYLLTGDVLKVTPNGIANLSEEKRLGERSRTLDEFGMDGIITYPAKGEEQASVAVFTDIDCPYCRKFHNEVPELNDMGITVHYYGFPRSGPDTPSFAKYVSVWCADDQQAAMDAAKQGRSVASQNCENPVDAQYRLGQQVGVTGTPAIVTETGRIIPGYRPARQIAEALGVL